MTSDQWLVVSRRRSGSVASIAGCLFLVAGGCEPQGLTRDWERIDPPVAAVDFSLPQLAVRPFCFDGWLTTVLSRIDLMGTHQVNPVEALDGAPIRLSDLKGRVVVMEFWATWCGPCRASLPSLEAIAKRYRRRGVTVLLINEQERASDVRAWTRRRFSASRILLDEDGVVARQYHVEGIPRLFLVDPNGQVLYEHAGYGGGLERYLSVILDGLLASHPATRLHAP